MDWPILSLSLAYHSSFLAACNCVEPFVFGERRDGMFRPLDAMEGDAFAT
jgi:hypothetical protein